MLRVDTKDKLPFQLAAERRDLIGGVEGIVGAIADVGLDLDVLQRALGLIKALGELLLGGAAFLKAEADQQAAGADFAAPDDSTEGRSLLPAWSVIDKAGDQNLEQVYRLWAKPPTKRAINRLALGATHRSDARLRFAATLWPHLGERPALSATAALRWPRATAWYGPNTGCEWRNWRSAQCPART